MAAVTTGTYPALRLLSGTPTTDGTPPVLTPVGTVTSDLVSNPNVPHMFIAGVRLISDTIVAIPITDPSKIHEARILISQMVTNSSVAIVGDEIIISSSNPLAPYVTTLGDGSLVLDMTAFRHDAQLWPFILGIIIIGAITYFGLKYLCKAAGLWPTNAPPPPTPPPPPPTNQPPVWTNGYPGGIVIAPMPGPVVASFAQTTSPQAPLFNTESPTDETYGWAIFDSSQYGSPYTDAEGSNYLRCAMTTIQVSDAGDSFRDLMSLHIWANDQSMAFTTYSADGTRLENVIIPRTPYGVAPQEVRLGSVDMCFTNSWSPVGSSLYRVRSSIPVGN